MLVTRIAGAGFRLIGSGGHTVTMPESVRKLLYVERRGMDTNMVPNGPIARIPNSKNVSKADMF